MFKSFRARLIVWNLLVITGALIVFSAIMIFTTQRSVANSIDQDLRRNVEGLSRGGPVPRGPGGPMGNGGGRRQDGPLQQQGLGTQGPPPENEARGPRVIFFDGFGPPRGETAQPYDEALRAATETGPPQFKTIQIEERNHRVVSMPFRRNGQIIGVVQDIRDLTDFEAMWAKQWQIFAILLPFALGVAGGAGWFLSGRVLRPVQRVTDAAERISDKDLSLRLDVQGEDELSRLALTFNGMLERLESAFASRDQANQNLERALDEQKRFTADASHELRTPLTRIKLAAGSGQDPEATPEEMRDALGVTNTAADTMSRLVEQLLTLARADSGQLPLQNQEFDLRDVVPEAVMLCGMEADSRLRVELPGERVPAVGDRDATKRIVVNFLENASRFTPAEGTITIHVPHANGHAGIIVSDTGEGIAAEHLPKLTERFYRVDQSRSRADGGTGLGLAICRSLAEAMGGEIELISTLGKGTQARLLLPSAE